MGAELARSTQGEADRRFVQGGGGRWVRVSDGVGTIEGPGRRKMVLARGLLALDLFERAALALLAYQNRTLVASGVAAVGVRHQ